MTKNEKKVIKNLLERIDEKSYPVVEEIMNKSINELDEQDIGGLLTLFQKEVYANASVTEELITETLQYSYNLDEIQMDYALMNIELNNYNIKELNNFLDKQIKLLNPSIKHKTKNKSKSR